MRYPLDTETVLSVMLTLTTEEVTALAMRQITQIWVDHCIGQGRALDQTELQLLTLDLATRHRTE